MTGYGLAPVQLAGGPAFGIIRVSFLDPQGNDLATVETAGQQFPAKTSVQIDANNANALRRASLITEAQSADMVQAEARSAGGKPLLRTD